MLAFCLQDVWGIIRCFIDGLSQLPSVKEDKLCFSSLNATSFCIQKMEPIMGADDKNADATVTGARSVSSSGQSSEVE